MHVATGGLVSSRVSSRALAFASLRAFGATLIPAVALAAALSTPARAEGEEGYDLAVDKGQVTVTARETWHINQDYPWKLIIGDVKLDRTHFTLTEKSATITDAPKGSGKLRGAVCSKDVCKMVEREVVVR